jgi:hypothetical protein
MYEITAFPVTINTAMVSPIARPIPKIAPAVSQMQNMELPLYNRLPMGC